MGFVRDWVRIFALRVCGRGGEGGGAPALFGCLVGGSEGGRTGSVGF